MLFALLLLQSIAPASLLAEGNAQFSAGAYAQALGTYHRVLNEGQASGALYYNLGLTYVRLDSLGRAVQYFEKARLLDPDDARIGHNLSFVRARLGLTSAPQPTPYWQRGWRQVQRAAPSELWWWLGFAFVCLAAGLLGWRLWSRPRDAWLRRGALAAGLAGATLLGLAYTLSLRVGHPRQAVALETVVVRDTTGIATPLKMGEIVVVHESTSEQRRVVLPSGVEGWVPAALLGEI